MDPSTALTADGGLGSTTVEYTCRRREHTLHVILQAFFQVVAIQPNKVSDLNTLIFHPSQNFLASG